MKIVEIDQYDKDAYKVIHGKDFDDNVKSIIDNMGEFRDSYNILKNSNSKRNKDYITSQAGYTMDDIINIDNLINDALSIGPDKEAMDIKSKLIPIYNELKDMYDSIKY